MSNKRMGQPTFLVLKFLEEEINAFLADLRRAFGGSRKDNTHITVRGPYYRAISRKEVKRLERVVMGSPIRVRGQGVFWHERSATVYLRAHHDLLKEIWWKPDFPEKEYGFNPHVTIHRTSDSNFASTLLSFLEKEQIEFISNEFRLVSFVSKQYELFPNETRQNWSSSVTDSCLVARPGVIERAANLADDYHIRSLGVTV